MYDVKGKWALITGAARGIGYLSAKFMAEQGCNLILHSRDLKHTEKVLDEVRARGVSAVAVAADLNDPGAVERMLKEAGAKVTMTRTTDTEVSPKHRQATDVDELQARCDVANKAKADIFISIHMDSFTSREASGTTGYYYTKGSAASKRLAAAIQSDLVGQLKTTSRGIKTCQAHENAGDAY